MGVQHRPVDVSVVTSGHDVADARLHREVAALVRRGLRVEVLGLGEESHGPPAATVRTWARRGRGTRLLRAVRLPLAARGRVLLSLDPDTAVGIRLAGRLRGRRTVADVHEDYRALLHDRTWARGPSGVAARVLARLAERASAGADLTVVADDHVPPAPDRCRRRLVVRNAPDLAVAGPPQPPGTAEGGPPVAVYVGDLRTSRGLRTMVEAIAAAPPWTLDLVGPVAAGDEEWLRSRVGRPDVAGRVRCHGRLPPAQAWQVAAGASVGLVMLEDTPAFRQAMPTKLAEYLVAGLAVLASPLPRVRAVVEESGAGRVVVDADQAAAVLREWWEDPAALARHRAAAVRWARARRDEPSPYDELASAVEVLLATE